MNRERIGQTIAYLRTRAGYTQQDLADRIGISDKAVSKWERGLSVPDVAYLGKLATLLDTDSDSILAGIATHTGEDWEGLLVLPTEDSEITVMSMVYSKPLVYFLLSYFILVGIKRIFISCNEENQNLLRKEFNDGKALGLTIFYCGTKYKEVTDSINHFSFTNNLMVISERFLLYGVDQTRFFYRAMNARDHITILSLPKKYDESVSSLVFDSARKLVPSDSDEKIHTQYDYYEIPVIFCPKCKCQMIFQKNIRGELEVKIRAENSEQLYTEVLDRGFVLMSVDNADQLLAASEFVKLVQNACGMEIYCLEEIAWRRGLITLEQLELAGKKKARTSYGQYILSLVHRYQKVNCQ